MGVAGLASVAAMTGRGGAMSLPLELRVAFGAKLHACDRGKGGQDRPSQSTACSCPAWIAAPQRTASFLRASMGKRRTRTNHGMRP